MPGQSQEDTLLTTPDVQVRILTLESGDSIPWHHHTLVTDHTICLEGEIEVRLQEPEECFTLKPGQRHETPPNRIHTIVNQRDTPAKYLLIQGVGEYDFIRAD